MKTRHAAPWLALLLMATSAWGGEQAPAQPGPAVGQRGHGPMAGRGHGMAGLGGMGMMGGWEGWGGGMMGHGYGALDLTKDQRTKLYAIHRDLREKQFALMDRMHDTMESVSFYRNGSFDEQAARNAYAGAEKIHRQMFENMLEAQKRAAALLTPQQRQQLSQASQ